MRDGEDSHLNHPVCQQSTEIHTLCRQKMRSSGYECDVHSDQAYTSFWCEVRIRTRTEPQRCSDFCTRTAPTVPKKCNLRGKTCKKNPKKFKIFSLHSYKLGNNRSTDNCADAEFLDF